MTRKIKIISFVVVIMGLMATYTYGRSLWVPFYLQVAGKRTISDVVDIYGEDAKARLRPYFQSAGISYPPSKITLLGLKAEKRLELWATNHDQPVFIRSYDVKAASGVLGPKLREGDKQVPEGIYSLEYLNPNSAYHLSMKINYPNPFDRKHAAIEGRTQPGTNIFIHGKAVSVGCLAMGDSAIEELFILVNEVGRKNVEIAIAPNDPRERALENATDKKWVSELYGELSEYFLNFHKI